MVRRCFGIGAGTAGKDINAPGLSHERTRTRPRRMKTSQSMRAKMRRLEAHGAEFKFAPVFNIKALRMLMAGSAKEYFDIWGRTVTLVKDASKS